VQADVESHFAGIFNRFCTVFLDQGKHSQDAAETGFSLPVIDNWQSLPMWVPACSARRNSCTVLSGIFLG
jgi:hypothetical protein